MTGAANKGLIKLLFGICSVFPPAKTTKQTKNNTLRGHKLYRIIKSVPRIYCGRYFILQHCSAASEYSTVSIQTPGKSQLPSRMSHEKQGNHRQWCGPLQGKPRCGGIPLRKSTPPPPPAKKSHCSCRIAHVCSLDQSWSWTHPVQVRLPNRRKLHIQRLYAIGRGGTKGRSILSVLTTAPSLAGDVGMGI